MIVHIDSDSYGPGPIEVVRQDGTRELITVRKRSAGGMGCRTGSDFYLRRVQENPDVWECRCLLAILGSVHMCEEGKEVEDPFDPECTANWEAGRGLSKEQAVQALCDAMLKRVTEFWAQ